MAKRRGSFERTKKQVGRRAKRSGPPGNSAREGRVASIVETDSGGQRVLVEDAEGVAWRADCLGEPVSIGARVRFEPVGELARREAVVVRMVDDRRERWVCTLRRIGGTLIPVPFGGVEVPALRIVAGARSRRSIRGDGPHDANASAARDFERLQAGDRVVVAAVDARSGGRGRGARTRAQRRPRERSPVQERAVDVRVVGVLGQAGLAEADVGALVWKHRLPTAFSRRARLEADSLPDTLSPDVLARRLDLRALPFVTIDPASARDHDDALFAEANPAPAAARAWTERLWVAIADVGHFVAPGSFIDAEARRRANSFYFPDRAIPMLPERLSSALCSLRPGEDRLVMAVELRLSGEGEVVDAHFHEAVIRSRARLAYEEAARRLASASEGRGDVAHDAPEWRASLARLDAIAQRLALRRRRSGAIELDLPEVEIEVDDRGQAVDARLRRRSRAHALVEEAMLAANRAVARVLERARLDTLHRVHPPPAPRRLEELARSLGRLGLECEDALDEPGAIPALLARVDGLAARERVHVATLRSLAQARYEARSRGHFALQFPHYLHFTSPIRRYADLVVHRTLKRWLADRSRGAAEAPREAMPAPELERLALWLSGRERVAAEVEREAQAFACCSLLAGREGELFAAEVTGIGEPGIFVRCERPVVSGLVPLRTLPDRYELDLEGERIGIAGGPHAIEIGTRVDLRLTSVDGDRGRVAFALVERSRGARDRGDDERPRRRTARARNRQVSASDSERTSHSR